MGRENERGRHTAATCHGWPKMTQTEVVRMWLKNEQARTALLEDAIRHVLRRGKVGKQSEARLRAALRAVEVSRA